jgi:hypothetical protein
LETIPSGEAGAMSPKPAEMLREAEHGHSERTPAIALTGVFVVVCCAVALVVAIAALVAIFA